MKPETAAVLDMAYECLAKADGMLDQWPDKAGREAYLISLHAAQKLIVERVQGAAAAARVPAHAAVRVMDVNATAQGVTVETPENAAKSSVLNV